MTDKNSRVTMDSMNSANFKASLSITAGAVPFQKSMSSANLAAAMQSLQSTASSSAPAQSTSAKPAPAQPQNRR